MLTIEEQQAAINALRDAYGAFNRGDISSAVAMLDSNVEWTEPAEFPFGGTYRGPEGVAEYLTRSRSAWAEGRSEPEQFIPVGDCIVVFVHARVRPHDSQEWRDVRLADVFTFRTRTVTHMRAFAERDEALQWAMKESSS